MCGEDHVSQSPPLVIGEPVRQRTLPQFRSQPRPVPRAEPSRHRHPPPLGAGQLRVLLPAGTPGSPLSPARADPGKPAREEAPLSSLSSHEHARSSLWHQAGLAMRVVLSWLTPGDRAHALVAGMVQGAPAR